jgi:hypothetical protein
MYFVPVGAGEVLRGVGTLASPLHTNLSSVAPLQVDREGQPYYTLPANRSHGQMRSITRI